MYLFSSLVHSLHCQRFFACWKKNEGKVGSADWDRGYLFSTEFPVICACTFHAVAMDKALQDQFKYGRGDTLSAKKSHQPEKRGF